MKRTIKLIVRFYPLFFLPLFLWSQKQIELTIQGDTLTIQEGGILYVEGGVWNQPNGQIFNDGTLYIEDSLRHDAINKLFIDTYPGGSMIQGTVILFGGIQRILGNGIAYFDSLLLRGYDKKIMEQDVYVETLLDLGDIQFITQNHGLYVENPNPGAIIRQNGMVTSALGGYLYRKTNTNQSYIFPVGDSLPVYRYRPVEIKPYSSALAQYAVRFANIDPTLEGWDRNQKEASICLVNPDYYHQIKGIGAVPKADVAISYDLSDPVKDGVAQWNGSLWQNLTSFAIQNSGAQMWVLPGWDNYITENFAFIGSGVKATWTPSDTDFCMNEPAVILSGAQPQPGTFFIDGSPLPDSIFTPASYSPGPHLIQYVYSPAPGCSDTVEQWFYFFSVPVADFSFQPDSPYVYDPVLFSSTSIGNTTITSLQWWINNQLIDTSSSFNFSFDTDGNHVIVLEVVNEYGCRDTAMKTLYVLPLESTLFIPNVITPNDDGINDLFTLGYQNLKGLFIQIYDRWGNLIFEGDLTKPWDGTNKNGQKVPEGAYVYLIKATLWNGKKIERAGTVTVIY